MTAAAFQATFSDWKLIRTRKVVQLVFEVPVEQADQAYQVLGGMPDPGKSVWCAVARLNEEPKGGDVHANNTAQHVDTPPAPQTARAGRAQQEELSVAEQVGTAPRRARRSWNELSAAEQAGIRCEEPAFHKFLSERWPAGWAKSLAYEGKDLEKRAAGLVRELCEVMSRSQINAANPRALELWSDLDSDYRLWMMVPA